MNVFAQTSNLVISLRTATDLINPRLVNNISGMGSIAQGAEGLVIAARGGRDGCNTSSAKNKKTALTRKNIAFYK